MRLLFLRGQVPRDRDPRQIMFESLEECDDMWTQLASRLAAGCCGEVWYWGGERRIEYGRGFTERWMPSFASAEHDFGADVVFARGGFPAYDCVLERHAGAKKVYYGAGRRFLPSGSGYDLILTDTHGQLATARRKFPGARCELLVKPAADNIFRPAPDRRKEYDVIFVGNEHPRKGHRFAFSRIPRELGVLHVGKASGRLRASFPHIDFTGWIPRRQLPALYGKAKVAVCCCDSFDSCPRVVPEAMACDCPLLALDSVRLWREKYMTERSGMVCSRREFPEKLLWMVRNRERFSPREHYESNLSMDVAARRIADCLDGEEVTG